MIVGGVSLEAALPVRQDHAETASIIVNGRKRLKEQGHRGGPYGINMLPRIRTRRQGSRSIFSYALNFRRLAIAALVRSP